jgi:hypothetical protein
MDEHLVVDGSPLILACMPARRSGALGRLLRSAAGQLVGC